jgi:hypothetical protein
VLDPSLMKYLHRTVAGTLGVPITLKRRVAVGPRDPATGQVPGSVVSGSVTAIVEEEQQIMGRVGGGLGGAGARSRVSEVVYTVLIEDLRTALGPVNIDEKWIVVATIGGREVEREVVSAVAVNAHTALRITTRGIRAASMGGELA